ncbi:MAG: N-acetyltransferase [bacterium]
MKTDLRTPSAESIPELPIRAATLDDVVGIHRLLKHFSDRGTLLPRPESDIYHSLREFQVVQLGEKIVACCALQIFTRNLGEIRSLAVSPEYAGFGLGKRLVHSAEQDAQQLGLGKLMALTYEVQFFNKLGFDVVEMNVLPEKVWGACINCHKFRNCDEIAVLKILSSQSTEL